MNNYCLRSFNMGRYNYVYPCWNVCQNINNNSQYEDATGFMRLHIIDKVTGEDIPYATITIYVTDEERRDIPIMHLVTTINPARIELPIANKLGTLIEGPEYNFSTYNISVDIFGYFTNIIYNNRLFPNVTTDFVIEMIPITQPQQQPIIERRTEIPPHPRDVLEE
ncbi:MAG TPA: hypothetical protein PLF27_08735 [Sedimentibacter sp.]|nr:hypothetical protein [Sedimentibacter sp.]HOK48902.1 hypothetical protein [Sedimentibacter sp.]HOV27188.1 hypothetical protein [Pseudobacteroides sp.]HRC81456.1 hypothetical protein [Sedimentibacter sp.]